MTGTKAGLRAGNQAVQEARFAGACQDQHAGRPAPSLGWPGEGKRLGRFGARASRGLGLGPGPPGAWGPGQGLGAQATRAAWAGCHFKEAFIAWFGQFGAC